MRTILSLHAVETTAAWLAGVGLAVSHVVLWAKTLRREGAIMFKGLNVVELLAQLVPQLEKFVAGQPVTINVGPETVDVGGLKIEATESITLRKAQ